MGLAVDNTNKKVGVYCDSVRERVMRGRGDCDSRLAGTKNPLVSES